MAILLNLKTSKAVRKDNDPTLVRRTKLLLKLHEQAAAADALIAQVPFAPTKTISRKDDLGNKQKIEVTKRFKPWFWNDADGSWFMEIFYGVRALPIGKQGETAIVVGPKENLPKIIKTLASAVHAGEFDSLISPARNSKKAA